MRIAFLAQNACSADAIGSQLAAKVLAAMECGHECQLFLSEAVRLRPELVSRTHAGTAKSIWCQRSHREYLVSSDAIVVEFGGEFPLLDLLPKLAYLGKRIIFVYHGVTPPELWFPSDRHQLQRSQMRRAWAWFASEVWATSEFTARELHEATRIPLDRVKRLPCVIANTAPQVRNGQDSSPQLLFVGRIAPNKDLPTLLKAVARLRHQFPTIELDIIGDITGSYALEAARCRSLASAIGIAAQVHFKGRVADVTLAEAFRTASALVIPSRHEGFGMPAVEAMAAGLPVVAADAGALPETLGAGGLTFRAGDPDDLTRQLARILTPHGTASPLRASRRIAIVSPRFGADFAGGAERSLLTIAHALTEWGIQVEVFTTRNRDDSRWDNHLPKGTTELDGILVHRFAIDSFAATRLADACQEIQQQNGAVSHATEHEYLANSLGSTALIAELQRRDAEFDAVLAGPYLFKLTWQVANAFKDKLVLVPCFHDEPYAFLDEFRRVYSNVGGYLFHTAAEMEFAQRRLKLNHPRSYVVGTLLDRDCGSGNAEAGRRLGGKNYFVYCGRYCAEKGLDRLLDWSERIAADLPEFRLVLLGHGALKIPDRPWLRNLGYVDEATKRDVLAGATALVNLSPNESLSIVLLESWAHGVPVIGYSGCAVVARQIALAGGGVAVANEAEFATAVRRLLDEPAWRTSLGTAGRKFTQTHYQDQSHYTAILRTALTAMERPLRELMREAGSRRAQDFSTAAWRARFRDLLETSVPTRRRRPKLSFRPFSAEASVPPGQRSLLISVRATNNGTCPAASSGLGKVFLWTELRNASGRWIGRARRSRLPAVLTPGQEMPVALKVAPPKEPGRYQVAIALGYGRRKPRFTQRDCVGLLLNVTEAAVHSAAHAPLLAATQAALAAAESAHVLPLDYRDITEGWFAAIKRFCKQKLLHNFRKAYMEPLVRQQTEVNQLLVRAAVNLAEATAIQNQLSDESERNRRIQRLQRQVRKLRRQVERLTQANDAGKRLHGPHSCPGKQRNRLSLKDEASP